AAGETPGSPGAVPGPVRPGGAPGRPATGSTPVSRRAWLAAAGAVAAGASGEIEPVEGTWVPVAPASALADGGAQRFSTSTVVGFVSQEGNDLRAVSGACTHQGCLLRLNVDAGRLDCPCHRTAFALDGKTLFHQLAAAPA